MLPRSAGWLAFGRRLRAVGRRRPIGAGSGILGHHGLGRLLKTRGILAYRGPGGILRNSGFFTISGILGHRGFSGIRKIGGFFAIRCVITIGGLSGVSPGVNVGYARHAARAGARGV